VRFSEGIITFLEIIMDPLTLIVVCFGGAVATSALVNLYSSEAEKVNKHKNYWEK
jgi:hypothetical protein